MTKKSRVNREHTISFVEMLDQKLLMYIIVNTFYPKGLFEKVIVKMILCSKLAHDNDEE